MAAFFMLPKDRLRKRAKEQMGKKKESDSVMGEEAEDGR
jgi:hypothetical protein